MAGVPADRWLIAFGLLAGSALLASLLLAVVFVLLARRRMPSHRAIALSFATQAVLVLIAWLAVEDPRDGLRFYVFILAPLAVAHLLLLPFFRRS